MYNMVKIHRGLNSVSQPFVDKVKTFLSYNICDTYKATIVLTNGKFKTIFGEVIRILCVCVIKCHILWFCLRKTDGKP